MIDSSYVAQPAVYAGEMIILPDTAGSVRDLKTSMDMFLSDVTYALQDNGCNLIGHIKGLLDAYKNGHLFFSITSFEEKPQYKGKLTGINKKVKLTINIIVYGIDKEQVEGIFSEKLAKYFKVIQDPRIC